MSKFRHLAASSVLALGAAFVASAVADPLPKNISTTAYGTTSAGYAAMVAVGNAIADDGYKLRVLPAKNDVSRMTPLMRGKVEFSAMGVGSFQAQEACLISAKSNGGRSRSVCSLWAGPIQTTPCQRRRKTPTS